MTEIHSLEMAALQIARSKKAIDASVLPHLQKILAVNFAEMGSELDRQVVMTATLPIRMGILLFYLT
jgi:hypothetical protein